MGMWTCLSRPQWHGPQGEGTCKRPACALLCKGSTIELARIATAAAADVAVLLSACRHWASTLRLCLAQETVITPSATPSPGLPVGPTACLAKPLSAYQSM
jgi:hypothetical protein